MDCSGLCTQNVHIFTPFAIYICSWFGWIREVYMISIGPSGCLDVGETDRALPALSPPRPVRPGPFLRRVVVWAASRGPVYRPDYMAKPLYRQIWVPAGLPTNMFGNFSTDSLILPESCQYYCTVCPKSLYPVHIVTSWTYSAVCQRSLSIVPYYRKWKYCLVPVNFFVLYVYTVLYVSLDQS